MTSSPVNSSPTSPVEGADFRRNGALPRSHTIDIVEDRIDSGFKAAKRLSRRSRKSTHTSLQEWDQTHRRPPYHEYVHQLVLAGWDNLQDLDNYMSKAIEQQGLVISVLDISDDFKQKRWPDMNNTLDLRRFLDGMNRDGAKIRLYMAEYQGEPSASVIETFGNALTLDPRFFQWAIHSKGHVFTPSQRHRAPYVSLGFGVLNASTPSTTDAEKFKVLVYIQPDKDGSGWTGLVLFSTHTAINLSPRILTDPPAFKTQLPPRKPSKPVSFREIYIESFEFVDLQHVTRSPFYAMAILGRLNCFCWNQIITAIREEDRRINGISDTSVGHAEEIKKSLAVIERGGSLTWPGRDEPLTKQTKEGLEEDFKHLVDQTDLLWQTRDKIAAIRQTKSEARWNTLTNAFTYFFAPITIISGIYGMNVSQISGSTANPNIWQFFVAVAAMNIVMVLVLALSNWVHVQMKHRRAAGVKEIFGFAVGRLGGYDTK